MGWSSVRIRLTLWNGVIVAVLMIAFGSVLCVRVQGELSRSIDAGLAAAADPLRIAPPFFPPPALNPEDRVLTGGPISGPGSGFGVGTDLRAGPPGIAGSAGLAAGPGAPPGGPGGGPTGVAFGAVTVQPGQPARGGILVNRVFGGAELAEDGLTPLPRFFAQADGPVAGPGPTGEPDAWDPIARAAAANGRELYSTVKRAGTRMRVLSVPMRRRGKVVGVIQVAHSLTDQDRLAALQASTLWIFIPLSVLVSVLTGGLLTGCALRPVRRLTQTADEIGASDLSRRLEVRGDDEFAELGRTFNRMIARLGDAFQELERGYHRIEEAYTRLQVAYEHERRFTGDASHELGTPLARIKACCSLALSTNRSAASYRASLERVEQCTDAMTQIVGDLLLLARGDAAQIGLKMEALSAAEVAREAVDRLGARQSGPRIHIRAPRDLEVRADREYLLRVLTNLLGNAIRHTPTDGSVVVDAGFAGRDVILVVQDTGEGIPPEHLPHVFERFYRVDTGRDRHSGGTGLGLAICQSIVSAHRGSLEIESEAGCGTRVMVRLPRTTQPDGRLETASEPLCSIA